MDLTQSEVDFHTSEIANKLGETDAAPIFQIKQIIQYAGLEFATRMLEETLDLETSGGMLTADGARRRTPGGVFFYVAKGKLDPTLRQQIFPTNADKARGEIISWDRRTELIDESLESGELGELSTTPRITLYGRPKHIAQRDHSMVMIFEYSLEKMSYTRGIPQALPETTRYTVYLGKAQWERTEKLLKRNPKDNIIIEGTCMWDSETNSMAVFALFVTTKTMDKNVKKHLQNQAIGGDDDTTAILPARPVQSNQGKPQQDKKKDKSDRKPSGGNNNFTKTKPTTAEAPSVATPKVESVEAPALTDASAKLAQLEQAAITLRERITTMEAKNQPGINMTRKLLENTERQIEALKRDQK